jgi:DNA-binding CsgD family transcriptional regulator
LPGAGARRRASCSWKLWPEQDPARLANRLSVALATVPAVLDPDKRRPSGYFVATDKDWLRLDPEDVAELLDRRRRADALDELTSREREVLGLMAEGLTDRGIAQRLYVTPKTVETHTRHISKKLNLPESALENKRVHAVLTYLRP